MATAALLAASLAWLGGEYALDRQVERTVFALQRAGFRFAVDHRSRGGWPFSATLVLHGLQVDGPAATPLPGGDRPDAPRLHWSAQRLTLQASPLHPLDAALIAGGTQRLRLGAMPELTLWSDRLAAYLAWRAHISPGQPLRLPFEARALHAAIGQTGPDWVTTIATASGHLLFSQGGNLAAALRLEGITLPQAGPHPLGRVVDRLSLALALPPFVGKPGRAAPGWPGGEPLLLQDLALDWASLHLGLRGTLYLTPPPDPAAPLSAPRPSPQPLGRFSLSVSGMHQALQDAVGDGDLPAGEAASLNGLMGLIEQANGGRDSLRDLPLLLHDGVWSLGAVPLWRMP